MNGEEYAYNTVRNYMGKADRKKIGRKLLWEIIVRSYYAGQCSCAKDLVDIQRASPTEVADEIRGDIEMMFSVSSKKLNKYTDPKVNVEVKLEDIKSYQDMDHREIRILKKYNNFNNYQDVKEAKEEVDALMRDPSTEHAGQYLSKILEKYKKS